jgi:glycine cleavage system transcriptional repressor
MQPRSYRAAVIAPRPFPWHNASMAKAYAVVSAIGADRVGIVDDLSGIVSEGGGNIEESKMAVLGGEFAVMMLVSMDPGSLESLMAGTEALESRLALKIGISRTSEGSMAERGRPYSLETVSLDGKGIVHSVSAVLRKHGINIEDLETRTERAPLTGAPLFRMKANVVLGPEVSIGALRRELEELQTAQDLDIVLMPLVPTRRD